MNITRNRSRATATLMLLLLAVSAAGVARAHERAETRREIMAYHLVDPVTVDGRLDEAVWSNPSCFPLTQNDPDNGAPPRQRTDWWVAYDKDALYIAAHLFEDDPDSIRTRLGRRDTWPDSDWIFVNLDTFNDDRNAFSFSVNPSGVIGDGALYNDGWSDNSWDAVWDRATRIGDDGWTVEMRIPFSQLNFPNTDEQVWGINFSRRYLRCSGREELFHMPRNEAGYMKRFPDLVGIKGIETGRRLEVLAYGATKGEMLDVDPGDPFNDGSKFSGNTGLDMTWGLTSNLTFNGTLNPDFGQVEVDPAVVNLSDFETYFEEKRPFFVEDANVFRFGQEGTSNNVGFNWSDPTLFYSRRVGRAPQVPIDADSDFEDVPSATTILGAGKITGKVGNTSIGLMNASTAKETADYMDGTTAGSQTVEPFTNYLAGRVKQTTPDGKRGVGLMVTDVYRDLNDPYGASRLVDRAMVAGLDGWTKFARDRWSVRGYMAYSRVRGEADAIDRVQRASRRYMQRPDADHVDYDPARTSLNGWIGRAMLNKDSGDYKLNAAFGWISPGFESNDLGFQSRADYANSHLWLGRGWSQPKGVFRQRSVSLGGYRNWDTGGTRLQEGVGLFYDTTFINYWGLSGMFFYNPERNDQRATRGGPMMREQSNREMDLNIWSNRRSRLTLDVGMNLSRNGDGSSYGSSYLTLGVKLLPSLSISPGVEYSSMNQETQFVENVSDEAMTATYGTRHVFGHMDYDEISFPTRVDWTFSPSLTLQAFVQPLVAVGNFRDLKEFARGGTYDFNAYGTDNGSTVSRDADGDYVIDPDGDGAAEAFTLSDPDFNRKYLKVNMVLRWEYNPGSTFYLVWTQDRANFEDPGDFGLGRDIGNLLQAPGDDIVMVKLTTWLDF